MTSAPTQASIPASTADVDALIGEPASPGDPASLTQAAQPVLPWPALVCFVLTLTLFLPWLNRAPLAGTEGHRALTAHQMVESRQWLLPTLYGRLYLAKPPLHHWLIATTETIAGTGNEFVWRLPSVLSAAALNAMLAFFAGRWFGRTAAWVGGVAGMALVVLWSQQSTADIDSSNTLFACLAVLCWIELLYRGNRSFAWTAAAGLAFGASLMVKGPGGLPIIVGVLVWFAIDRYRSKNLPDLKRSAVWLPAVIGLAIFGLYVLAAAIAVRNRGFDPDLDGLIEGGKNLAPGSLSRLLQALSIGPLLLAYALPLSLSLVAIHVGVIRRSIADADRRILVAIAGSFVVSLLVCTLSGMVNPRYGYITLPPLAILTAGVVASAIRQPASARVIRDAAVVLAAALAIGTAVMAGMAWKHLGGSVALHALVATAATAAVAVAALAVTGSRGARVGLPLLPAIAAIVLLLSVPFGLMRAESRDDDSGIIGARALNKIVPRGAHLETGAALTFQPELFHYAGLDTLAHPKKSFTPDVIRQSCWVLLTPGELSRWRAAAGGRLGPDATIPSNGSNRLHVAWYSVW
ncbi:ArnT family glycosyltransferase [Humisphaera borealis]|uniref:Glycosyltransferase family 39 protein n=1 Tax=Humisphaera borealis TaxID=2807512 RepID=A0A7M2X2S2_9BACT|nr:glycosyltransferase family 39 protein [Humisphaera borealis]QOV91985.1 glycosyltransferase family 39 protein [Humisphaera borealis]